MIWLYSRIGRDDRLLSQFVDHYQNLGVDRMLLCADAKNPEDPVPERVRHAAVEIDAVYEQASDPGHSMAFCERVRTELVQRHCEPTDWVLSADVDEFQVYPEPLDEIVRRCEASSAEYVGGRFVDRIASDGSLAPLSMDRSVWEQYPIGARLTHAVLGACDEKVVLSRAAIPLGGGHHAPKVEATPLEGVEVEVHHFKWDASVVERCRWHRDAYKDVGDPWWRECQRFLDYLAMNHGRIDLSNPSLEAVHV